MSELKAEQKHYLSILRDAGGSLLAIINDILDFSRIESGKLKMEQAAFRLDEVVMQSTRALQLAAANKGVDMQVEIRKGTVLDLVGDPMRLRQILGNLVSNAVKFTAQGVIRIDIHSRSVDATTAELQFAVSDTGIGVAEEKRLSIFEAFTQADQSTTRNYGGTGLGLSICRHLVDMMQGRIWVDSQVGHGSVFYFTARFGRQSA
jgi:signal transduction histidine kinase